MADLKNLWKFFENADQHAEFLHRVAAAIQGWAIDERAETPPGTVTGVWVARQTWAVWALKNPLAAANQVLPGLAHIANEAGLIDENGNIDATDQQIRNTVNDDLVDRYAGYVPPEA